MRVPHNSTLFYVFFLANADFYEEMQQYLMLKDLSKNAKVSIIIYDVVFRVQCTFLKFGTCADH